MNVWCPTAAVVSMVAGMSPMGSVSAPAQDVVAAALMRFTEGSTLDRDGNVYFIGLV